MKSIWLKKSEPLSNFLDSNLECDVAIVGGGITGMSVAHHLSKAGLNIVVLEKGNLSSGNTGYSGGFLACSTTYDFGEMVDKWNEEKASRIYASISEAIISIKETIEANNINCDFKNCGAFYIAAEKDDKKTLEREHDLLKNMGTDLNYLTPAIQRFQLQKTLAL